MIFQPLDKKQECKLFFYDGSLNEQLPANPDATWKYVEYLNDIPNLKFANLYCGGKNLEDVCPEELRCDWAKIAGRLKSYLRAFSLAKINLKDVCFFDLTPEVFLLEYFDLKSQITEYVFEHFSEPDNYDFLLDVTKLTESIKNNRLNIDAERIKNNLGKYKTRQFIKKIPDIWYKNWKIDHYAKQFSNHDFGSRPPRDFETQQ